MEIKLNPIGFVRSPFKKMEDIQEKRKSILSDYDDTI